MRRIDLSVFTGEGRVKNLSGKPRGEAARTHFALDELDQGAEPVTVVVPDYIYTISTSFFCGLFAGSFQHLGGSTKFLEKYHFEMPDDLWPDVESGLERCSYTFTSSHSEEAA